MNTNKRNFIGGGKGKLSKYTKRNGSSPLPTAAAEKGAVGRAHAHNSIPQHTFKKKPKRRGGASRRIDLFFGCVALSFRPYLSPFLIFLSSTFFLSSLLSRVRRFIWAGGRARGRWGSPRLHFSFLPPSLCVTSALASTQIAGRWSRFVRCLFVLRITPIVAAALC